MTFSFPFDQLRFGCVLTNTVKTEVDIPRLTASQSMGNIEQAVDAVVLDPSVSVSVPNIATDPGNRHLPGPFRYQAQKHGGEVGKSIE